MFGLERNGQRKCVVVLSHAREANAGARPAIKPREVFFGECARELTRAVCAIVKKDYAVAVLNGRYGLTVFADYNNGFNKFIRHAFFVRLNYRLNRVAMRAAFAVSEQAICLLCPLPSLVTIHRVVATY